MQQQRISAENYFMLGRKETPEDIYHRALWELELARANFDEALAAYAKDYAESEALTAKAIENEEPM